VEILVTVGLMGLVATIAIGPLAALVNRLEAVQAGYAQEAALSAAARSLVLDCRQVLPHGSGAVFRTIRKELIGGRRADALLVWTGAPISRKSPAATEVFALLEPGPFRENVRPGLYRWVMPGILPGEVFVDRLDPSKGTLLVKNADRFAVRVFDGKEWVEDFSGPYPAGLSVEIGRKKVVATHVDTVAAFGY
jgi:hypothetical protein